MEPGEADPQGIAEESRNPDGTFGKGNPYRFDADSPRSPGRPKKDAWVRSLEAQLEADPKLKEALSRRLLKIALSGRDGDAIKALDLIEDRAGGGPVVKQIELEANVTSEVRNIMIVGAPQQPPALPREVLEIEAQRAAAENAAQKQKKQDEK